jgi:hypothetical protein
MATAPHIVRFWAPSVREFHLVSRVPVLSAVAVGAAPYGEQPGRGGAIELVR